MSGEEPPIQEEPSVEQRLDALEQTVIGILKVIPMIERDMNAVKGACRQLMGEAQPKIVVAKEVPRLRT